MHSVNQDLTSECPLLLSVGYKLPVMGCHINLQDDRGVVRATISENLLPRRLDRSFTEEPLLIEIDGYGDTVF